MAGFKKPSGPAIFMYCVIALGVGTAALCFYLYYGGYTDSSLVKWSGITAFTVTYHFWVRIIMGNVTKLFPIDYRHPFFRERPFEKHLYKALRVRYWRDRVLTYNPELYVMAERTPEQIAQTTAKAETDHWVNEIISVTTIFFSLIWGAFPIFFGTALAAMLFDAQFIVVQRYNRPRLLRIIQLEKAKKDRKKTDTMEVAV